MLDGRDRLGGIGLGFAEAEQERVLAISHDRNDPNRPDDIRRQIDFLVLVFRLGPIAAARVDVEAKDGLVLAALQSLVNSADLSAVGVLQREDGGFAATEISLSNLEPTIPLRP